MRVSLCVICGNETQHIVTMLNSFSGVFDELSLVRAVGASKPDDTCDLAQRWCLQNGKDYVFAEHKNGLGCEGWEHIDDFAAARIEAFHGGTGDWLIWADCDDVFCGDAAAFRHKL